MLYGEPENLEELATAGGWDPSATERVAGTCCGHRLGGENVFLHEELGIVRLLLGSGDDPDMQTFIDDVTGRR